MSFFPHKPDIIFLMHNSPRWFTMYGGFGHTTVVLKARHALTVHVHVCMNISGELCKHLKSP